MSEVRRLILTVDPQHKDEMRKTILEQTVCQLNDRQGIHTDIERQIPIIVPCRDWSHEDKKWLTANQAESEV